MHVPTGNRFSFSTTAAAFGSATWTPMIRICRDLAARPGAITVSVGYRLAPEHVYPAAVDDGYAALEWVHAHAADIGGDATRLAVGGDSAGGNLAAAVSRKARDLAGPTAGTTPNYRDPATAACSSARLPLRMLGTERFPS